MADMRKIKKEMAAAEAIKEGLAAMTDDAEVIRDTLEGETDLHEMIADIVASIGDDIALVDGLKERLDALKKRIERFKHRIDQKKALVYQAMEIAELTKMKLDTATISKRRVPPKAVIVDESAIPSDFFIQPPPRIDRAKLNKALRDGQSVPGAELDNGGETIAIRTL